MAVVETEGRAKPPIVDELGDGEEIVEAVLQRRAGKDQGEPRAQPLDDTAGLGLPVLDSLAFVKNDQIPLDLLDRQDVTKDLLVVADRKEAVVLILRDPGRGAADDELAIASAEPLDFASPL